jgi:CheY-like chemotaxis protein
MMSSMEMRAVEHVGPIGHVRILLADDDDDIRDCIGDVLELHGADVFLASSGNEAFRMFLRERPHAVLSDLWMPDGDGFELIRSIRARDADEGGLTPAIALSAAEHLEAAMMAGYHAFIAKPFEISDLMTLLADFTNADGVARPVAPWTIQTVRPGLVLVALHDDVRGEDIANLMSALFHHLDGGPVDVHVDLQQLVSFAPSVGSVGERALWSRRRDIRSLRIVGGSFLARLVSASACKILGIPFRQEAAGTSA